MPSNRKATAGDGAKARATWGQGRSGDTEFSFVPIDLIDGNPHQPREHDPALNSSLLAGTIETFKIINPVIIRPNPNQTGRFQMLDGERRRKAARRTGLVKIPALIRYDLSDDLDAAEISLISNLQRLEMNGIEEAMALKQILSTNEQRGNKMTPQQLSRRIGFNEKYVERKLKLLNLIALWQTKVIERWLLPTIAVRTLAGLDHAAQHEIYDWLMDRLKPDEGGEPHCPTEHQFKQMIAAQKAGKLNETFTLLGKPRANPGRTRDPVIRNLLEFSINYIREKKLTDKDWPNMIIAAIVLKTRRDLIPNGWPNTVREFAKQLRGMRGQFDRLVDKST